MPQRVLIGKDAARAVVEAAYEVKAFRQNRFTGEKWREQFVKTLDSPCVMQIRFDKKCHQRAGIDDDVTHRILACVSDSSKGLSARAGFRTDA